MKRTTMGLAIVSTVAIGTGIIFGLKHQAPKSYVAVNSTGLNPSSSQANPSGSASAVPTFDKKQYSIDDPTSIWIVVDKLRPLNPKTYTPNDLTSVGGGQNMRAVAAEAYKKLVAGAQTAGYTLIPESGYRSYNTQASVYGNEVKNFGQAVADTESARPGYSEHQTGWAIDIASPGCIEDCFGTTAASKWMLANAASYGFIRRYAPDKSDITGYRHEPWHFRYVGQALATEVTKTGQTLEEFFGLPAAPNY